MNEEICSVNAGEVMTYKPDNMHFIRHFLSIKSVKSINTSKSYERDIKTFFNVDRVEDITLEDIRKVNNVHAEQYIMYLQKKGYSSATVNRKISSLSALYRWLMKYRENNSDVYVVKYNPFQYLKNEKPVVVSKETEFLTKEECKMLLASIDTSTLIGLRDKAILALAFTTALRKSEIINIRLKDIIRYGNYHVIEVIRKGGKKDLIKLQDNVRELIELYVKKSSAEGEWEKDRYLFLGHSVNGLNGKKLNHNTLNLIIKRVCDNAGIDKKLKVHSTRHTAITMVINEGVTLEKVRDFAGHANISTTNRYLHSVDKIENNPGDLIDIF
ncbi:tyrosine recombinase XerC subunit [Hathewaya proteolytica DSM 3090]|uniref:Tyrosine recombinase XerC subunit n=1 Tax=Hathewaya proteolytica DSM 3090 TaxID=1121331 RepID=A0A1M6KYQ4_9CLOT|nr:tyrosine-type recombinase/integrase [Hathewaya proteolytica]SHJ64077.1 tyrosine recombinase XerC subunit [Hathewaya proteolytica DSM 3090]